MQDQEKINLAIQDLDEVGRNRRDQAIAEGCEDAVCPNGLCGVVILAHKRWIRCGVPTCPIVRRKDGKAVSLLDELVGGL